MDDSKLKADGTSENQHKNNAVLVDGRVPIFHCVMDINKLGLTKNQADLEDMADEYAIVENKDANAGLIVYGKYNNKWKANPWSTRFLVRELLSLIDIHLPPIH